MAANWMGKRLAADASLMLALLLALPENFLTSVIQLTDIQSQTVAPP
ncbi:MAG: hypothetical protein AAFU53_05305 [Cyanobacteria bacterium J06632_3]